MKTLFNFVRKHKKIFSIVDGTCFLLVLFLTLIFRRLFFTTIILSFFVLSLSFLLFWNYKKQFFQGLKVIPWNIHLNRVTFFLLVLGILIVLNIIGAKQKLRFDLTKNQLYTLSPQTKKILQDIKEPLQIVFFRSPNELNEQVSQVLHLYADQNNNITLNEYDPDIKPIEAKKYSVLPISYGGQTIYSSIYLLYQNKTENLKGLNISISPTQTGQFQQSLEIAKNFERSLTSAILRLQSAPKKIYFLEGHNEGQLTDNGKEGYSKLKLYLAQENYDIDFLYLSETKTIPSDCALLVLLSPKRRFEKMELYAIDQYLKNKGRLFVLIDPRHRSGINRLMKKWGFVFRNDYVVDKGSPYWQQPVIPFVRSYPVHPINNNLNSASFFPETSSIYILNSKTIRSRVVVQSSKNSWSDVDFETEDTPIFDEEHDVKGPVPIIAEFENFTNANDFKIVASGDSDFVANYAIDVYGNLDLFLNIVNFLAERTELNTIRKKQSLQSILSLSQVQLNFIFYFFVILIPFGVAVWGGVYLWKKKQKK